MFCLQRTDSAGLEPRLVHEHFPQRANQRMSKLCRNCGATIRAASCDNPLCGGGNSYRIVDDDTNVFGASSSPANTKKSLLSTDFAPRLCAYLLDIAPILLLTVGFYYIFFGFDNTLSNYTQSAGRDVSARRAFVIQRNQIRDISFLVYLIYSCGMDASVVQGTHGKRLMKIKVVDAEGQRISIFRSIGRNAAKFISCVALGLGILWAIFSSRNLTWHDSLSQTSVTERT